jgi:diguanylate cyclase (GGDEF)-like protein
MLFAFLTNQKEFHCERGATMGSDAFPEEISAAAGAEDDGLDDLADNVMTFDLVSGLAGDRQLTDQENSLLSDLKKTRGELFYSDLLHTITHQFFPPSVAENLWNQILRHKYDMSYTMKRNIRIAVASLDFLSNLTSELRSPTVIDERRIAGIIDHSLRDGLTRLFNHTACFHKIKMELSRFERYGTLVSVMMIDIDDFKKINDTFGHAEGDGVLAVLGKVIVREIRDTDICCRYGGEEFTVIMPSTGIRDALALAERLREKVEQSRPLDKPVTISIGVASCDTSLNSAQLLVNRADEALYLAKRNGKNRVESYDGNAGAQTTGTPEHKQGPAA